MKNSFKKFLYLFVTLLVVVGCSATSNVKNIADESARKKGFLATNIYLTKHYKRNVVSEKIKSLLGGGAIPSVIFRKKGSWINTGFLRLEQTQNLKVVPLDPGEYMWNQISSGGGTRTSLKGGFSINPGETTYVGDILLNVDYINNWFGLKVKDNSTEIKKLISKEHPEIINNKFNTQINPLY